MIQEATGYFIIFTGLALIVGGCLKLSDMIARDQMEEELESWEAGDQEWLKQLLEERRREFDEQIRRKQS